MLRPEYDGNIYTEELGNEFEVKCRIFAASGRLEWSPSTLHDDERVTITEDDSHGRLESMLYISSVDRDHRDTYTCTHRSELDEILDSVAFELNVTGKC